MKTDITVPSAECQSGGDLPLELSWQDEPQGTVERSDRHFLNCLAAGNAEEGNGRV